MYYVIDMEERLVIWDEAKNADTKSKHKVSFETAQYIFSDPSRIWRLDRSESNKSTETRWQTIGKVGSVFFFVVYTEQENDGVLVTRLITARKAEKHEKRSYYGDSGNDNKGWTKDT